MFWNKEKMTFSRKLTDAEKEVIGTIVDKKLPYTELAKIEDFLQGYRHMRRYPKGHKKEKKRRPAFSNHMDRKADEVV